MRSKPKLETLLIKHLGKRSGDALLREVDKMVKRGATPAKIEKAMSKRIATHMSAEINRRSLTCPLLEIGPKTSVYVQSLQPLIGLLHKEHEKIKLTLR